MSTDATPGTKASGEAAEQLMEMPTLLELQRTGHKALVKAIHQWGGREEVARRLGLACSPCVTPPILLADCTFSSHLGLTKLVLTLIVRSNPQHHIQTYTDKVVCNHKIKPLVSSPSPCAFHSVSMVILALLGLHKCCPPYM